MEIFNCFQGQALEVILIAAIAFLLTYLVKLPIKNATKNMVESKRKMVNVVILFIPLVLCFAGSCVYFVCFKAFDFVPVCQTAFSAFLLSLSMYAIVSRLYLVLKGMADGKASYNSELSSDMIKYIKQNITDLLKKLKVDEKEIKELDDLISDLFKQKELVESDKVCVDLAKLADLNSQITQAKSKKSSLETEVADANEKLAAYKDQLYQKPQTQD